MCLIQFQLETGWKNSRILSKDIIFEKKKEIKTWPGLYSVQEKSKNLEEKKDRFFTSYRDFLSSSSTSYAAMTDASAACMLLACQNNCKQCREGKKKDGRKKQKAAKQRWKEWEGMSRKYLCMGMRWEKKLKNWLGRDVSCCADAPLTKDKTIKHDCVNLNHLNWNIWRTCQSDAKKSAVECLFLFDLTLSWCKNKLWESGAAMDLIKSET